MKLESIVLLKNKYTWIATIRFSDHLQDRIVNNEDKDKLYKVVSRVVRDALSGVSGQDSRALQPAQ